MDKEVKITYETKIRENLIESIQLYLEHHNFKDEKSKNLFEEKVKNQTDPVIIKFDILHNEGNTIITVIYLDYVVYEVFPRVETFKIILCLKDNLFVMKEKVGK